MTLSFADFVEEGNSATGTSAFVLTGATTDHQTFATALGASAQPVLYVAQAGSQFEIGVGTFNGTTGITRAAANVVRGSAGAGVLVNFSSAPTVRLAATADTAMGRLNRAGTTDPGINDDQTLAYSELSLWLGDNRRPFINLDDSDGAAVWQGVGGFDRYDVPGQWQVPILTATGTGGLSPQFEQRGFGVYFAERTVIEALAVRVTTASASGNFRIGVHLYDPASPTSSRLLYQSSDISANVSAPANVSVTGLSVVIPPGRVAILSVKASDTTVAFQTFTAIAGHAHVFPSSDLADFAAPNLAMVWRGGGSQLAFFDPIGVFSRSSATNPPLIRWRTAT
jgi:hypothetical protein